MRDRFALAACELKPLAPPPDVDRLGAVTIQHDDKPRFNATSGVLAGVEKECPATVSASSGTKEMAAQTGAGGWQESIQGKRFRSFLGIAQNAGCLSIVVKGAKIAIQEQDSHPRRFEGAVSHGVMSRYGGTLRPLNGATAVTQQLVVNGMCVGGVGQMLLTCESIVWRSERVLLISP